MKITDILYEVGSSEFSSFLYSPAFYNEDYCHIARSPAQILRISTRNQFNEVFGRIEELRKEYFIVSLINYEAGYLFEDKFEKYLAPDGDSCLITLLLYDRKNVIKIRNGEIEFPDDLRSLQEYRIDNFRFNTGYDEYISRIANIKKYIYDGDTYQVNYTLKSKFDFTGSPESLFLNLVNNQSTRYSAFINMKDKLILSVSPELFFETKGDKITTRPMKGTVRRGINLLEDSRMKKTLQNSDKDRAENVMIVDLLRNDFGRICEFGSVSAKSLFDIEMYESVFQMTSTIEGRLKSPSLKEILENVFPCGSITGAPKIRTMEIIKELEKEERGIYTGSIGFIDGDEILLNVAIRTLVLDRANSSGEMGLGGGIVWDSCAGKEYSEAELKGKFLSRQDKQFRLIESILLEKGNYFLLGEHLERIEKGARYFLFNFNRDRFLEGLEKIKPEQPKDKDFKVRVLLNKQGKMEFSYTPVESLNAPVRVKISENRVSSRNKFQYFKTTERELYDQELENGKKEGFFDTLFLNEKEEFTEGAITNLFIYTGGFWKTPSIECGVLNGCYRRWFIENMGGVEALLTLQDIRDAQKVILVNSVRKEIPVAEIEYKGEIIWRG